LEAGTTFHPPRILLGKFRLVAFGLMYVMAELGLQILIKGLRDMWPNSELFLFIIAYLLIEARGQ
jgi:hypothetical protein